MKKPICKINRIICFIAFALVIFGIQPENVFGQSLPDYGKINEFTKLVKEIENLKNEKPQQFETASKTLSAASEIVLGKIVVGSWQGAFVLYLSKDQTPKYKGKFDEGLKPSDAADWIKERILVPKENVKWRKEVTDRVFEEVYGREANIVETTLYSALMIDQKAWFTKMIVDERGKLKNDSTERKAMINRAYQKAMGRTASEEDLKYWMPRYDHFAQIVAAAREYLYSPNGAKDLRETVTRAYQSKYKNSLPETSQIVKLTADFSKLKLIYVEMIKN